MANVTFDGPNKLIICNAGTIALSVQDTYSYWKEWTLLSDNSKYLQAMSVVGGDPTVSGRYLGSTYFLENGWKIRPQSASHTLTVDGNLYARTGSPFVACLGTYNVQILQTVTNLIDTVATGGSDLSAIESKITDLHDEALGRWVLDPDGDTLTLYRADGSLMKTFSLTKTSATVSPYIERVPQ